MSPGDGMVTEKEAETILVNAKEAETILVSAKKEEKGAAEGTRTPAYSLASCRTTPILRPLRFSFPIYSTGARERQAGQHSCPIQPRRTVGTALIELGDASRAHDRRT